MRGLAVAAISLLLVGVAPAGGASAAGGLAAPRPGGLPDGWRVVPAPTGQALVWDAPSPLRLGGARPQIVVGGLALPTRVTAGARSLRADLPAGTSAEQALLAGVEVSAAGRRLDVPQAAAAQASPQPGQDRTLTARALEEELAALPEATADPAAPGPFRTVTGEYVLDDLTVPGLPAPVEMRGVVVSPVAPAAGRGGASDVRPLVVLLHGRHATCFRGGPDGEEDGSWPCPAGWSPVPSHRGYLATQRLLASQGYVTVSLSANGVNGQDGEVGDGGAGARAALVEAHLDRWRRWSASAGAFAGAPDAVRAGARADLSKVLLVGHSRGGDGMNRVALDAATGSGAPWTVRGVVHVAPTAFGQNVAPGVPVVVLLPQCDGDVFDLQGQAYLDAARDASGPGRDPALRTSVLVLGANHNFFNSEWTPGRAAAPAFDDWFGGDDDWSCGRPGSGGRLSPAAQRDVGAFYVAAAADVHLAGRADAVPLLDGSAVRPRGVRALVQSLGGRRTAALLPGRSTTVTDRGAVTARACRTLGGGTPQTAGCAEDLPLAPAVPHFRPVLDVPGETTRDVVEIRWKSPRGAALVGVGASAPPADLSAAQALSLRLAAVPQEAGPTVFEVRVADATGRTASLGTATLVKVPRAENPAAWLARDVHLPLTAAATAGVDLRRVVSVEVVPRSATGRLWLLDAWGWAPGLATRPLPAPARIDATTRTVHEGSTVRPVPLTLEVSGRLAQDARVRVVLVDPFSFEPAAATVVRVPKGSTSVTLPVTVHGDTREDQSRTEYAVALQSVSGIAVGGWRGGLQVLDDDPPPTVRVTAPTKPVVEGSRATWRITLSAPSDLSYYFPLRLVAPAAGAREVDSADVTRAWLEENAFEGVPRKVVPMSRVGLNLPNFLDPGVTEIVVSVPTVDDHRAEGPEKLVLLLEGSDVEGVSTPQRFAATVVDAAP